MKLFIVAKNSLKKRKADAIVLFLLITLASVMLYTSISVLTRLSSEIDAVEDRQNGADFFLATGLEDTKAVESYIRNYKDVLYLENTPAIFVPIGTYINPEGNETELPAIFEQIDGCNTLSRPEILDRADTLKENSIVLPYCTKFSDGLKTGDTYKLKAGDETIVFEVYGFIEDTLFLTPLNVSTYRALVSASMMDKLAKLPGSSAQPISIIRADITEGIATDDFEGLINTDLQASFPELQEHYYAVLNPDAMKVGAVVSSNIVMAILALFSLVILIITVVIIRYSVVNQIELNMANYGIMKAAGYTGRQLVGASVLENTIITAAALIVSAALAPFATLAAGRIVSSNAGFLWRRSFDITALLITILVTFLITTLTTLFVGARFNRVSILDSLRSGIKTHNYKKNHFPLDKTHLKLSPALGLKEIFHNKKSSIGIFAIAVLLSFACCLSIIMYSNYAKDSTKILDLTGMEISTLAYASSGNSVSACEFADYAASLDEVNMVRKKVTTVVTVSLGNKEYKETTEVFDECHDLKINENVREGHLPFHDNEIVISKLVCNDLGAKLGDVVTVSIGDANKEFVLCGIIEHISYLGRRIILNFDGYESIGGDTNNSNVFVYAKEGASFDDINSKLTAKFGSLPTEDSYSGVESITATMKAAFTAVCVVFVVCTILITILVIILCVRMKLTKDRISFGVDKALGFTTSQLITRVIWSFVPTIALGSLFGGVLATLLSEKTVEMVVGTFGITNVSLDVYGIEMLVCFAIMTLTALTASFIKSQKLRKLAPAQLLKAD